MSSDALAAYLQAVSARCEQATKGPWKSVHGDADCATPAVVLAPNDQQLVLYDCSEDAPETYPGSDADADFIASARTDCPTLVRLVRELSEIVEAVIDHGDYCQGHRKCQRRWPAIREALARAEAMVKEGG